MFSGSCVAMVTPFQGGKVDDNGLRGLVRFHLEKGTNVLVPCGTTGEAATLSEDEFETVVSTVVDEAAGRVPVMAGTGSYDTGASVARTKMAKELGANAALVVTPYYNKPTQEGLYRHYMAIAEGCDLPVMLYNVPSRTSCNMLPETVERLAEVDHIFAIKEASGSVDQIAEVFRRCGDKIAVFSGDDALNFHIGALGGKGYVTVLGNICPAQVAESYKLIAAGKLAEARAMHYEYLPLIKALFIETNPIPVKTALAMMGKISDELRLPLCPMSEPNKARLGEVLKRFELIS